MLRLPVRYEEDEGIICISSPLSSIEDEDLDVICISMPQSTEDEDIICIYASPSSSASSSSQVWSTDSFSLESEFNDYNEPQSLHFNLEHTFNESHIQAPAFNSTISSYELQTASELNRTSELLVELFNGKRPAYTVTSSVLMQDSPRVLNQTYIVLGDDSEESLIEEFSRPTKRRKLDD